MTNCSCRAHLTSSASKSAGKTTYIMFSISWQNRCFQLDRCYYGLMHLLKMAYCNNQCIILNLELGNEAESCLKHDVCTTSRNAISKNRILQNQWGKKDLARYHIFRLLWSSNEYCRTYFSTACLKSFCFSHEKK